MNHHRTDVDPTEIRRALIAANAQVLAMRAQRAREGGDAHRAAALQAAARRTQYEASRI